MASCSAAKAGGKKEKGGDIGIYGICLPKLPVSMVKPCCLETGKNLPGDGLSEWAPCSALLAHTSFVCLSVKPSLSQPGVLSLPPFRFSPPSRWRGVSERFRGAQLPIGVNPRYAPRFHTLLPLCSWEHAQLGRSAVMAVKVWGCWAGVGRVKGQGDPYWMLDWDLSVAVLWPEATFQEGRMKIFLGRTQTIHIARR